MREDGQQDVTLRPQGFYSLNRLKWTQVEYWVVISRMRRLCFRGEHDELVLRSGLPQLKTALK